MCLRESCVGEEGLHGTVCDKGKVQSLREINVLESMRKGRKLID
jgi:hypothetical protein